jgi:hypothetical protein
VRSTRAANDNGEDVDVGARRMDSDGICEGCVFGVNQLGCVGDVVVRAVLPFPYLDLFLLMSIGGDRLCDRRNEARGGG